LNWKLVAFEGDLVAKQDWRFAVGLVAFEGDLVVNQDWLAESVLSATDMLEPEDVSQEISSLASKVDLPPQHAPLPLNAVNSSAAAESLGSVRCRS
jgi:hypothetical protein